MLPPYLKANDEVRIVSPSGAVEGCYIDGAAERLASWGFKVTEGEYARGKYGRYAGTTEERLSDLQKALSDPDVKAVVCSRGGYGLVQIIDQLDISPLSNSPKWIIGFSDITVLHNALTNKGIASLHAIMAKDMANQSPENDPVNYLKTTLLGGIPDYTIPSHHLNVAGTAEGKLIGGNLSVLNGLRGTAFDLPYEGSILFIEDIGEEAYKIDRIFQNLRISGILEKISGLIVGQFTDYNDTTENVEEIISSIASGYGYPVCFNFPAGHIDYNLPLILGENISLEVNDKIASVNYL